ncbi:hypothetical protein CIB84_017739, partial [Bambusicola thoracicus]
AQHAAREHRAAVGAGLAGSLVHTHSIAVTAAVPKAGAQPLLASAHESAPSSAP